MAGFTGVPPGYWLDSGNATQFRPLCSRSEAIRHRSEDYGETAAYIARYPDHSGGIWRASLP